MASVTVEAVSGARRGRTTFWRLASLARLVGVGVWAGALAGLIAGGIGSRVMMRVVALMAGRDQYGKLTEAGEVVGEITLEGTVGLLVGGTMLGMAAGVLYVALSWWLLRFGRYAGLLYGAMLLAVFGAVTLDGNNFDFTTFGSPALSVLMISSLYLAFGLLVAPVANRLDRVVPTIPPATRVNIRTIIVYLLVLPIGALFILFPLITITGASLSDPRFLIIPLYLIAAILLVRWAMRSGESRRVTQAGLAVLALPVLLGAAYTLYNVGSIVRDGYL